MKKKAGVTRPIQMEFARMMREDYTIPDACEFLREHFLWRKPEKRGTWGYFAQHMNRVLLRGQAEFTVFADGNMKLPFKAYSNLPIVTCPGAGECKDYCYSLKAWRYPAAFFRQCQNLWLLRHAPSILRNEFLKFEQGITFRLYVDGDFHDLEAMKFWFDLLKERPDIQCYGYSKSWELFLRWNARHLYLDDETFKNRFPVNYKLNLSNGSIYDQEMRKQLQELPCTRGNFVAVDIPKESDAPIGERTNIYRKAVRQAAKLAGYGKAFVCPGQCGTCTPKGHACGLDTFSDINIAIGVH
tara:strand:+ start:1399 stop:2295 length:897 start_codon:yes stop_codon:yes gene_type:complete